MAQGSIMRNILLAGKNFPASIYETEEDNSRLFSSVNLFYGDSVAIEKVINAINDTVNSSMGDYRYVILVDFLESRRHPKEILGVAKNIVKRVVSCEEMQFFLPTHSIDLICSLTRCMIDNGIPSRLRGYRVNERNGVVYCASFLEENLTSWLKSGMDPRYDGPRNENSFSFKFEVGEQKEGVE